MAAEKTRKALNASTHIKGTSGSLNERQLRELAKVPHGTQADVLEKASENGKATAKKISAAAKEKEPTAEALDNEGWPIPPAVLETWNRANEVVQPILQLIIKARTFFREAQSDDPIFSEVRLQENIARLDYVFSDLGLIKPYAICTVCHGKLFAKCPLCRGRGYTSRFAYKTFGDSSTKKIRAKRVNV